MFRFPPVRRACTTTTIANSGRDRGGSATRSPSRARKGAFRFAAASGVARALLALTFIAATTAGGFAQVDVLFSEDFAGETLGAVTPTAIPWTPAGSASPDWENSLTNAANANVFSLVTTDPAGAINPTNKLQFSIVAAGSSVLLGAGFDPGTQRYVVVEYDVLLSGAMPTLNPAGEIYYSDSSSALTSVAPKVAIHIQFSDKSTVPDATGGEDAALYYTSGQDGNVGTDEGSEIRLFGGVGTNTWSLDTWYRVKVVADQVNGTFDIGVTRVSDRSLLGSATGLPYNDPTAGIIRKVWFAMTATAPTMYLDNVVVYQDSVPSPVSGPTIVVNVTSFGTVSANPALDVDFFDDVDLAAAEYQIDSGDPAGAWASLTTGDGVTLVNLSGGGNTSYTNTVRIPTAAFNALTDGTHSVHFRARDNLGNTVYATATAVFVKDATPPELAVTQPASGTVTYYASIPGGYLSGTALDAIAGVGANAVTVRIYRSNTATYWNGSAWQAGAISVACANPALGAGVTGAWSYNFPVNGLNPGDTLQLVAFATDLAGNASAGSPTVTITLVAGAPYYNVNTNSYGPLAANASLDVDFYDDVDIDALEYQFDGTAGAWAALTTDGSTVIMDAAVGLSYTAPLWVPNAAFAALADGTHQLYLRVYDGTSYVVAGPLSFRKDATAPAATLASPGSDPFGELTTVAGTVADAAGGAGFAANSTKVRVMRQADSYYWNGSAWQVGVFDLPTTHAATADSNPVPWTRNFALPTIGTGLDYTFSVITLDSTGNTQAFTWANYTYDATNWSWTGASSTDWFFAGNWDRLSVPPVGTAFVTIPSGKARYPVLTAAANVATLSIQTGASLDLNGWGLTLSGAYSNAGALILTGAETLTGFTQDTDSGLTRYKAGGAGLAGLSTFFAVEFAGGARTLGAGLDANGSFALSGGSLDISGRALAVGGDFSVTGSASLAIDATSSLTLDGTAAAFVTTSSSGADVLPSLSLGSGAPKSISLGSSIDIAGNLSITANATLSAGVHGLSLDGNFSDSGVFNPGTGAVAFTNASVVSTISGSSTFHDLTSSAAGKTLRFTAGTTQTIGNSFVIAGSAGNLIVLESTLAGSSWSLAADDAAGTYSADYASIRDSAVSDAFPMVIAASNSTNLGNNDTTGAGRWVFPYYEWDGSQLTSDWTDGSNWVGGAPPPNDGSADIRVPAGCPAWPVLPDADWAIDDLVVQAGAFLTLGANDLAIAGTVTAPGTLVLSGAGRPSKVDATQGLVRYTVSGGVVAEFGATDYWNLELAPTVAATFSRSATSGVALGVANALTVGANATLDLDANDFAAASLSNDGVIALDGSQTITLAANDTDSGTWRYDGAAGPYTIKDFGAGVDYFDLQTSGAAIYSVASALAANGTIAFGTPVRLGAILQTEGGNVTFSGSVVVTAAAVTVETETGDDSPAGAITVSGPISADAAGRSLTLDARGSTRANVSIATADASGGSPLGSLSLFGANATPSGTVATSGAQAYDATALFNPGAALSGGSLSVKVSTGTVAQQRILMASSAHDFSTVSLGVYLADGLTPAGGSPAIQYRDATGFDVALVDTAGTAELDSGGALTDSGRIRASSLIVNASTDPAANVTLDYDGTLRHQVSFFSARNSGAGRSLSFRNGLALSLGTVVAGSSGTALVDNLGAVVIDNANVDAGTGTVTIGTGGAGTLTRNLAGSVIGSTVNLQTTSGSTGAIGSAGTPVQTVGTTTLNLGQGASLSGAYLLHSGDLTLAAPSLAAPAANPPLSVAASGALTLPAAALNTGGGILSLSSGAALDLSGSLTSTASVTLQAAGTLTLDQTVTGGTVSATTTAGGIALSQNVSGSTVTLQSTGAIDQTAGALVAATLSASTRNDSGAAITLAQAGNDADVATLRALDSTGVSARVGNVSFRDADGVDFASIITDGTLAVVAGGAITDSGTLAVALAASFKTLAAAGAAQITLDDNGILPLSNSFGSLTLATRDAGDAVPVATAITVRENAAMDLASLSTLGAVTLQSNGAISDSGALAAASLSATAVGGIVLDAANQLGGFSAANSGSGAVTLAANTAAALTVSGITQGAGTGPVSLVNAGNVTVTGVVSPDPGQAVSIAATGLVSTSAAIGAATGAGAVTLEAADLALGAAVRSGSGALTLRPQNLATPIRIGGASDFALSSAELAFASTTGALTIGRATHAAAISIAAAATVANATGGTTLVNAAGGIAVGADFTAAGGLALTTGGAITRSAGTLTASTGNLVLNAAAGIGVIAGPAPVVVSALTGNIFATNVSTGDLYLGTPGAVTIGVAGFALDQQVANGAVRVDAGGNLTVAGDVTVAGAGSLELNAVGTITRTAGTLSAATLRLGTATPATTTAVGASTAARILTAATTLLDARATSGAGVFISNAGNVNVTAQTTSGAVDLVNAGTTTSAGVITAGTSVTVSSTLALSIGHAVTGPSGVTLGVTTADTPFTHTAGVIDGTDTNLAITADRMILSGGTVGAVATDIVTLRPLGAATQIALGGADALGVLGLTDAELNTVDGTLVLGGVTHAGAITVAAPVTLAGSTLELATTGTVSGVSTLDADSLLVRAGGNVSLVTAVSNLAATNIGAATPSMTFTNTKATGLSVTAVRAVPGISTNGGALSLDETAGALSILQPISTGAGSAALTARAAGAMFSTAAAGTVTTSGALATLVADDMNLAGAVSTGAGGVALRPYDATRAITLGGAGGLSLSAAELLLVTTTGSFTLGGPAQTGNIAVAAAVAPANARTIRLRTTGSGAISGAGVLGGGTGYFLAATSGSGGINLQTSVQTLAAAATGGGVTVSNDRGSTFALSIGTVDGVSGIVSGGTTIRLTETTGGIAINQGVNAGAGDLVITSDEAVTQGAALTAAGLKLASTSGAAFTLTTAGNDVTTLAAAISGGAGLVSYVDANAFAVGTVDGTSGITTSGGSVTLDSAGAADISLAVPTAVSTSGGTVTFQDPVLLAVDTAVTTGAGAGNILFNSTLRGTAADAEDLALTAGTGSVLFSGVVGSTRLGALSVASASAGLTANSTLAAASVSITAGGPVDLNGAVTAPGGFSSTGTTFDNTSATIATTDAPLSIVHTGNVTVGAALSSGTGALSARSTGGTLAVSGTVTTTSGAVSLESQASTLSLSAAVSTASGSVLVDSATGTTITAAGTITASGAAPVSFGSIGSGALTSSAAVTTAGGAVRFHRPVTLGASVTVSSGAGDVSFDQTVDATAPGVQSLTVNSSGTTTFSQLVGGTNRLGAFATDSGGTTRLGPGVRTQNQSVSFGDDVVLTQAAQVVSGTAATGFALTVSGDPAPFALTVQENVAGATGTVTFSGAVSLDDLVTFGQAYAVRLLAGGSVAQPVGFLNTGLTTLGDDSGDDLLFSGGVTATAGPKSLAGTVRTADAAIDFGATGTTLAANATTRSGTAATSFAAVSDGASSFSLTLQNLAGATGGVTFAGAVTIDDLVTFAEAYAVTLNGSCDVTQRVDFLNSGGLTLGDADSDDFFFRGGLGSQAAGTNAFRGTVRTDGLATHDIELDDLSLGGILTLNAGAAGKLAFTGVVNVTNTSGNAGVADSNGALDNDLTVVASLVDSAAGSLSIASGATVDLGASSFTIGTLSNGAPLAPGVLRLTGTQATHSFTVFDSDSGITEYYGTNPASLVFTTGFAGGTYFDLRIAGSGGGVHALPGIISVERDLRIQSGVLDVSGANHGITVSGNWRNDSGFAGFVSRAGTVTFDKPTGIIEVRGNNAWYVFQCLSFAPGLRIHFENDLAAAGIQITQRIVPGGVFRIRANLPANWIELNRRTDTGIDPANPPLDPGDDLHFWFFDLQPGATLDMHDVRVYHSNARSNPISVPASVLATPYGTYHSFKWLDYLYAIYSYTEDSDYDGKIDRIRVTTEQSINADFSGFTAVVEGYEVDMAKGSGGYERPVPGATFYIWLREKGYLDTGATPPWRIEANTTLFDSATLSKRVGTLSRAGGDDRLIPGDTAWPVIGYALTLPQNDGTFAHFSEPVVRAGGAPLGAADFVGATGFALVSGSAGETREAVASLGALSIATIASGVTTFSVAATTRDVGAPPWWEPAYDGQIIGPPPPTYPDPLTGYLADPNSYGSFGSPGPNPGPITRPPFELGRGGENVHRVSDLLVSIPPTPTLAGSWSAANPDSWFVWPSWAKDEAAFPGTTAEYEALSPIDAARATLGLVRAFDGSQWLRDQDWDLAARTNPTLGLLGLSLFYDSNVAPRFLSALPGIWLPDFAETDFSGLAAYPNTPAEGGSPSGPVGLADAASFVGGVVGDDLWGVSFAASDPEVRSPSTIDFWFRLAGAPADLYAGRLVMAPGAAALPPDWFRLVRPFSLRIRDIEPQKGSVTIMNNVIDPGKGETARLNYRLAEAGRVTVLVLTLDGDVVRALYRGTRAAGDYTDVWDGRNASGNPVARGAYFIRVVGPGLDEIRKVLVVKNP